MLSISRRSDRVLSLVEDLLQLLACFATLATFSRILAERAISRVFLLLPALLGAYLLVRRVPRLRQDPQTMVMLAGAVTGINSGFLSAIAGDLPQVHDPATAVTRVWGAQMHEKPEVPVQNAADIRTILFRHIELLHIPVLLGSLFYSGALVFCRHPPPRQGATLAATTALCGAVIIAMATTMVTSQNSPGIPGMGNDMPGPLKVFGGMFVLTLLLGLAPMVRGNQRPWLLAVLIFTMASFWHVRHLDTLVWDWVKCAYPVPGTLTGLTLIFIFRVHESGDPDLSEDDPSHNALRLPLDENEVAYLASKDKHFPSNSNKPSMVDSFKQGTDSGLNYAAGGHHEVTSGHPQGHAEVRSELGPDLTPYAHSASEKLAIGTRDHDCDIYGQIGKPQYPASYYQDSDVKGSYDKKVNYDSLSPNRSPPSDYNADFQLAQEFERNPRVVLDFNHDSRNSQDLEEESRTTRDFELASHTTRDFEREYRDPRLLGRDYRTTRDLEQESRALRQLDREWEVESRLARTHIFNALLWHSATYVVERVSLAFINTSSRIQTGSASISGGSPLPGGALFHNAHGSDVWISALTMVGLLGALSPYFRSGSHVRLGVVLAGLAYHGVMTLSGGVLVNPHFADMVLGITIAYYTYNT